MIQAGFPVASLLHQLGRDKRAAEEEAARYDRPGDASTRANAYRHARWVAGMADTLGGAHPVFGGVGRGAAGALGAAFEGFSAVADAVGLGEDGTPQRRVDHLVDLGNNALGLATLAEVSRATVQDPVTGERRRPTREERDMMVRRYLDTRVNDHFVDPPMRDKKNGRYSLADLLDTATGLGAPVAAPPSLR